MMECGQCVDEPRRGGAGAAVASVWQGHLCCAVGGAAELGSMAGERTAS